jgi:hypothetical protein
VYEIGGSDEVIPLAEFPRPDIGAPYPLVVADDSGVVLAYSRYEDTRVDPLITLVWFKNCLSHMFGWPNDDDLGSHPLISRGLDVYGVFRVENSSWIRELDRRNVHREQAPRDFLSRFQHLIFTFHDSTFECVCAGFEIKETEAATQALLVQEMVNLLASS